MPMKPYLLTGLNISNTNSNRGERRSIPSWIKVYCKDPDEKVELEVVLSNEVDSLLGSYNDAYDFFYSTEVPSERKALIWNRALKKLGFNVPDHYLEEQNL